MVVVACLDTFSWLKEQSVTLSTVSQVCFVLAIPESDQFLLLV